MTTGIAADSCCGRCGRELEGTDASFCSSCGEPRSPGATRAPAVKPPRPWPSWLAVGLAAGFLAFVALKAFNLVFTDPSQPIGTTEPLMRSSSFTVYGNDLARFALVGAPIVAPLSAWGRRGTAKENWQAAFIGLVLGALGGLITVAALGFLFSSDEMHAYSEWFGSGSGFSAALETFKWMIRTPWAGTWIVFGCFQAWFVATQSHGRRMVAAIAGALLVGAAAAATLELVFNATDIDPDLWGAILCCSIGVAVGIAVAIAVPQSAGSDG